MQLCSLLCPFCCISWVATTTGYKACLIYTGNTECLRDNSVMMKCESQNVLVWIAAKSADADLNLLDLSKWGGDPSTEVSEVFWLLQESVLNRMEQCPEQLKPNGSNQQRNQPGRNAKDTQAL